MLSEFPNASFLLLLFCIDYVAFAVLHSIDPGATVLAAIGVGVGALAVLFVEFVVAFVFAAVLPHIGTIAMHDPILELALEVSSVGPLEAAMAAHFIVRPNARVLAPVGPKVNAFTFLDSFLEEAVVVATVTPDFDSFSVLLLHSGHLGLGLYRVEVVLDVEPVVLPEHA